MTPYSSICESTTMNKANKTRMVSNGAYFTALFKTQKHLCDLNQWACVPYTDKDGDISQFSAHIVDIENLTSRQKNQLARKVTERNTMIPFYSSDRTKMYIAYDCPINSATIFVFYR